MWIFSFAPEWFFHLIFAAGIVGTIIGFVLGFIPIIKKYGIAIKVISLIVLLFGVYLEGGLADYREWELKAAELEKRAKDAEIKAAQKNVEIQEKVVEKINTVYKKGDDIIKYIDREVVKKEEVVKFVENCPIPKDIIEQHNAAAKMNKTEGEKK
jgi:hypothetical protein